MLGEPVVINLSDINFTTTKPYTRNNKGQWVQKPHIVITVGRGPYDKYTMIGKGVMWSYLDALFSDEPLPREPVNADIFSPDVDSPSIYTLLNSFTKEVIDSGTEYIVLYHKDGTVNYIESFNQSLLSDIDVMVENLRYVTRKAAIKKPFVYRSKNVTLRPSLLLPINGCRLEIIDIGTRWYYRLTAEDCNDNLFSLINPCTTNKKDGEETFATIKRLVRTALNTNVVSVTGRKLKIKDSMRTNEQDKILHMRGLSI